MATVCMFLSCKKSEGDASEACKDNNTTKVTFMNTTSAALRVVVSSTLTPQLEPISPILTIDLAAGQSSVKEFQAGRYANTWYNGCPSTCNRRTYSFKNFDQCMVYEEKQ